MYSRVLIVFPDWLVNFERPPLKLGFRPMLSLSEKTQTRLIVFYIMCSLSRSACLQPQVWANPSQNLIIYTLVLLFRVWKSGCPNLLTPFQCTLFSRIGLETIETVSSEDSILKLPNWWKRKNQSLTTFLGITCTCRKVNWMVRVYGKVKSRG